MAWYIFKCGNICRAPDIRPPLKDRLHERRGEGIMES